jgi:predicted RNA-binding protein YlxR (DUF448 family)
VGSADRTGLRPDKPQVPQRICVGCRRTDSRSVLLRVVVGSGAPQGGAAGVDLVPDPRRSRPGRGAWLHPASDCLDLAVRRRAFGRALRLSSPVDLTAVAAYVEAHEQTDRPPYGNRKRV